MGNRRVGKSAERLASMLQNTLHFVCVKKESQVLRFSKEMASALEAFPWSGDREQMVTFWEITIPVRKELGCLPLTAAPDFFLESVQGVLEGCDRQFNLL